LLFGKILGQFAKRGIIRKDIKEPKALTHIERLETAFFQVTSAISAQKDLNTILEVIAQESLNCLKANRSTIFLLHEKSEILKIQWTCASDALYKQVGLHEEREVAQKTLKQNKPFLLGGLENFPDFFKYEERERKITSLMSIPLSSKGKTMGVLSTVLINQDYGFDEKSLQFFSIFGNLASTAMEMVDLLEEVRKGKSFRITYERYLDNILNQLQSLSQRERERIDGHILKLQAEPKIDEKECINGQSEEKFAWVRGTITLKEESGKNPIPDEWAGERLLVDFEEESWGFTKNLNTGGAFIQTHHPMELGDEFLLKVHMPDGGERIEVACKVIWTNKYGKESKGLHRGMGIKFLNPQPEVQRRIEENIKFHQLQAFGEIMVGAQGFASKGKNREKS
jgi:Tfp pilus assembly protein PilZ